jgi:hypothetical protein
LTSHLKPRKSERACSVVTLLVRALAKRLVKFVIEWGRMRRFVLIAALVFAPPLVVARKFGAPEDVRTIGKKMME